MSGVFELVMSGVFELVRREVKDTKTSVGNTMEVILTMEVTLTMDVILTMEVILTPSCLGLNAQQFRPFHTVGHLVRQSSSLRPLARTRVELVHLRQVLDPTIQAQDH